MNTADKGLQSGHEWAALADDRRGSGEFSDAADYYTTAAYAHLAEGPLSGYCPLASWGLYRFLQASVCLRIAADLPRCRNHCRQGILIAEDVLSRVSELPAATSYYDTARRAAWYEYIGDLRIVADLSGSAAAYEKAKAGYRKAGDPPTGLAEQEHMRLQDFFRSIALPQGHDTEEWQRIQTEVPLSTWVEYKEEHLPRYLEAVLEKEEWPVK